MWRRRLVGLLQVPCQRRGGTGHRSPWLPRDRRTVLAAAARWRHTAPESLKCAWQLHGDHLGGCAGGFSVCLGRGVGFSWPCSPGVGFFLLIWPVLEGCTLESSLWEFPEAGLSAGGKSFMINEAVLNWKSNRGFAEQ